MANIPSSCVKAAKCGGNRWCVDEFRANLSPESNPRDSPWVEVVRKALRGEFFILMRMRTFPLPRYQPESGVLLLSRKMAFPLQAEMPQRPLNRSPLQRSYMLKQDCAYSCGCFLFEDKVTSSLRTADNLDCHTPTNLVRVFCCDDNPLFATMNKVMEGQAFAIGNAYYPFSGKCILQRESTIIHEVIKVNSNHFANT